MVSLKQAVDYAIKQEVKARNIYLKLSEGLSQPDSKKIIEGLAKMEQGHIDQLKNLDYEKNQKINTSRLEWRDVTEQVALTPGSENIRLKEIFQMAFEKEGEAAKRYDQLSQKVEGGRLKSFFQNLSVEERRHESILKQEYFRVFPPV